jgi:CHAD domain-containing protein
MELLDRPRDEACRVVALKYLDEAVAARQRMGQDAEALHDLRVALRRFRSTLRAWRFVLGRLRGRRRRELRKILDATSDARDAEVLLTLFADEQLSGGPLIADLERRKAEGYALVLKRLDDFDRLEARLRRGLARVELDLLHPHKLAHALGERMDEHADDVEDDLFELRAPAQMEEAHAARIASKRLRYLIEPYKDEPAVGKLVQRLKALQDVLGDLHDTHLAMAEAAQLADVHARLTRRQERLYAQLDRDALAALTKDTRALAGELRRR